MIIHTKNPQAWERRLLLPAYSVVESARYAGTSPQVVARWHYYKGKVGPALPGKEKRTPLSYLQLIEVAFVSTMRKTISLQKVRKAREYAAKAFNVEFPFAQLRWKTEGTHLLLNLKDFEGDADIDNLITADKHGQEAWGTVMSERFDQFRYEGDLALIWYVRGRDCPVVIDPRISFGAPTIHGLPTWVIKGRVQAGETPEEIEDDFNISVEDIDIALQFEGTQLPNLAS
jgi:uncharacterized protein (DUF433 family)